MKRRVLTAPLALALLFSAGCISNHHFAEHGDQLPDVAALERARLDSTPQSSGAQQLGDLAWFPLISLQLDTYGPSDPGMLPGNTLTESSAYGPLVMIGNQHEWLFDEQQRLYERRQRSHFLWGLWQSHKTDIRVPTGWRVHAESSLLFGLLSWPSDAYPRSLPGTEVVAP